MQQVPRNFLFFMGNDNHIFSSFSNTTGPPIALIVSVAGGNLLLLLVICIAVGLVLRRRRQFKPPDQAQMTIANSREEAEDEEDEEERDYENIEQMDNTRGTIATQGAEDDALSNDYEPVDCDDVCQDAVVDSGTEYSKREEHEVEDDTSSDENDYVNLAESFAEQSLDIYGGEDVYQNI
ncbi:unnamed protein product [Menidia menidia]|uniref:(Atlantic silverside) hypothetical protein n=1 Tax=Menidia menidia TaxID=238744 RepID=A0A8S4AL14_9TELE|nr:unnamed protein product [Menidia menidia]